MNLIVELVKYMMILLIGIYSYYSFYIFRHKNKKIQNRSYLFLTVNVFLLHFIGYFTLFLQTMEEKLVYLYCAELILFVLILVLYELIYPKLSRLLLRNMLMLFAIGFIMLTRLSFEVAVRQVIYMGISCILCMFVPYALKNFTWLKKYGWIYGAVGIILLLVVLVAGTTSYGATNWIHFGFISIQPSEFVKLLYVFSIAALFSEGTDFRRICAVTIMAGANVMILVLQKDLGGALIFFITYIFMLYAVSNQPFYLFGGLAAGSAAACVAYRLFNHVRVRVMAWQDPFKYIDKEGFQITQSLFAIGTGGWVGMGLNQGLPTSIPVHNNDFIFSAISEEMGGIFAICMVLIYVNCFIVFINISLRMEDIFYRMLSVGFSVMIGFQVFLSIGGVIKFIPSTGVTLPLVSSGGSSCFATVLMFMIIQGIYIKGRTKE